MNRQRLAVVGFTLVMLVLFGGVVLAQDGTKQVGVVIGLPNNAKHSEIVTVPAAATTFDVLQKVSVKLDSATTQFGPAVCGINGTGCPSDNCFCDAKRFWAYYHLDAAANKWVTSQDGVGSFVPADGAVEGFVWSETDANFNPTTQPPLMSLAQIKGGSGGGAPWTWLVPVLFVLAVGIYAYINRKRQMPAR